MSILAVFAWRAVVDLIATAVGARSAVGFTASLASLAGGASFARARLRIRGELFGFAFDGIFTTRYTLLVVAAGILAGVDGLQLAVVARIAVIRRAREVPQGSSVAVLAMGAADAV